MLLKQSRSIASRTSSGTAPRDSKNIYKSKRNYSDRNSSSLSFPEFDVKLSRISSVVLLLESKETDVVQRVF